MKRAVQLLMSVAPDAGHPDAESLRPTHHYVRFLPKDTTDLALLNQDTVLILSTVPYGYQNSMDLDHYHDPAIPEGEPTWLYTIAPVEYELPEVHHEILEEAYLPEDDEDELDLLALKLTGNLPNETIDGRELMSADLTDRELLGLFSRRYNPSGRILVSVIDDEGNRGNPVPVKNADIIVRTFWLSRHVTTNGNGDYYLHKRYKDRAAIRLSNRNSLCYVSRNWTEHIGLWMSDKIGEGKANLHIVIEQNRDDHRWYKATINNAFQDYDQFAWENGIPRPWRVRTYLLAGRDASSAPMLNGRPLTFYSIHFPAITNQSGAGLHPGKQVRNIGIGMGAALVDVMSLSLGRSFSHYPDITIGMRRKPSLYNKSSYKCTNDVRSAVIHELAHYSHRKKIGLWYWANVQYQALFDPTNGPGHYGDGQRHTPSTLPWPKLGPTLWSTTK